MNLEPEELEHVKFQSPFKRGVSCNFGVPAMLKKLKELCFNPLSNGALAATPDAGADDRDGIQAGFNPLSNGALAATRLHTIRRRIDNKHRVSIPFQTGR